MKKVLFTFALCLSVGFTSIFAQAVSASGQLGWAVPGGDGVSDEAGDLNLDGGLTYGIDVLYHFHEKIGAGIVFNRSVLAGAGGGDIDLFGLRVIGAKGLFTLNPDSDFTPFAGLTLGLSQLLTPEYSVTVGTETTVIEEQTGSTFAIMPEVGLSFKGVFLSAQYLIPGKYKIDDVFEGEKGLGILGINVGYRYVFDIE